MAIDKLNLIHTELIQEEGLKVSDLPVELQKKIKGFDLMLKKLEKNPEDERTFLMLQKNSVKIANDIQNFIESDYDDEEEDDEDNKDDEHDKKEDKKEDKEKGKDNKQHTSDKEEENKLKKPKSNKFGNLLMEKKILSIMQSRGEKRIRISDLESIIGKQPDYPEQEVNNLKLRKVFLSSDYRLL
jgi:hypothetical protein